MSSIAPVFAYRAQSLDGQPLSGTIDAASADQARERLESLRLRVLELGPATPATAAPGVRALRGDDFITFNQQLAHLTAAGLPMEQGLRLIAQDLRRGRVAATVRQIADDLEKGESLGDAFQKHSSRFPPAYGRLIDAGVRSNNLSGMLLSLGQHLQTVARLRSALWRALSYPVMVFLALCFVVAFIGHFVLPRFEVVFRDFGTKLPAITEFLLAGSRIMGTVVAAALLIALIILWQVLRSTGRDARLRDAVGLHLPLIGPTLKRSLISRWCDAVRLGISGGMDLPQAMRTAADAVGSPRLAREVEQLVARLEAGQPLDDGARWRLIPATVLAAMELSSRQGGPGVLAEVLGTLSQMYQQQARAKVGLIPAVLTPLMLALLSGIIGLVIVAMFAPLISLIRSVSGGGGM